MSSLTTWMRLTACWPLEMALHQIVKREGKWLIHHSDRGVQYCCTSYVRLLKKHSIQISMTEQGDPLENAIAERINRTIKELVFSVYRNELFFAQLLNLVLSNLFQQLLILPTNVKTMLPQKVTLKAV